MKHHVVVVTLVAMLTSTVSLAAEDQPDDESVNSGAIQQVDLETEPVAYLLRGAGGTVAGQIGEWRLTLEGFYVRQPQFLHGNEGFEASTWGGELHTGWFFTDGPGGWFVGPEFGITRQDVTHRETETTKHHIEYAVGLRGGYRWYPGLGNLYLNPHGGVSFTLNPRDFDIAGDTFESGRLTPFATLGIGWSFGR